MTPGLEFLTLSMRNIECKQAKIAQSHGYFLNYKWIVWLKIEIWIHMSTLTGTETLKLFFQPQKPLWHSGRNRITGVQGVAMGVPHRVAPLTHVTMFLKVRPIVAAL